MGLEGQVRFWTRGTVWGIYKKACGERPRSAPSQALMHLKST